MFNLTSIIQTGDLFVFIIYLLFPGLHIFSFDFFSVSKGKIALLIIWMGFIIVNDVFVVSYYKVFIQENLIVEVALPFFSTLTNFTFTYWKKLDIKS